MHGCEGWRESGSLVSDRPAATSQTRPDEARQAERDTRCVIERQAADSPKGKGSPNRERHENKTARVMANVSSIACRGLPLASPFGIHSRDESAEPQPPRRHMAAPLVQPRGEHLMLRRSPCSATLWRGPANVATRRPDKRGPQMHLIASVLMYFPHCAR